MERVPASITVRAIVSVGLLLVFYVSGFAILGILIWLTIVLSHIPGALQQLTIATVATAVGLVFPLWQIVRAKPVPPAGVAVSEEQAPDLWTLVRDVAAAVDTPAPDGIRLNAELNAGVWEDAGRIGLRRGDRYLYLGVPLLYAIDTFQLRAVVAHEMGHYSGGHTVFGAVVHRGGTSIARTITRIGPRRIGGLVLTGFAAVYFLAALRVMRAMELDADQASARVTGGNVTREVLVALPVLAATWEDTLRRYVASAEDRGYRPADLLDSFTIMERSEARPPERTPWDSHPPAAERISAIPCGPVTVQDTRPAVDLFGDPALAATALDTDEFADRIEAAARMRAEEAAQQLYRAADRMNPKGRWGLGSVLDLVDAGRAHALADQLPTPDRLPDYLMAAISTKLISDAGARWVHVWDEPLTLRSAADEVIELRPLVTAACAAPAGVAGLRVHLSDLGLDGGAAVASTAFGRSGFDPGPVFRTAAGTTRSEPLTLLLPDRLYLLAHRSNGRRRIATDVLETALAAATLAELRRRGHVELSDGEVGTVLVTAPAPTGDRFLDSVLGRLVRGRAQPAYQWLQAIGPEIAATIRHRLTFTDYIATGGGLMATGRAAAAAGREAVVAALRANDVVDDTELAMLLWAAELTKPVLGWTATVPRFFIGRLAARDPLMMAVRVVTGLSITLPAPERGSGT